MKTRSRQTRSSEHDQLDVRSDLDLDTLSDEELEELLFDEEEESSSGIWNLPTIAGLSLIVVGIAYIFQQMGLWDGLELGLLVEMLPWLAGILIILLGFGVLSWRPSRKKKKVKKTVETSKGKEEVVFESDAETKTKTKTKKKRLTKSVTNKKISGVCGGLGEYFNIDPTLIRIAFVIGTIASGGPFLLAYLALAFILPQPETASSSKKERHITIIRDS